MRHPASCLLMLCAALGSSPGASAASAASGSFFQDGKNYVVTDAVAWHGEYGIDVLLSDKALDAPQMLSDFKLDNQDQFDHDGASMRLTIYTTDGSSYSLDFRGPDGGGGDMRCDSGDHLKIARLDDTSIAGSFACEEHAVTFDLPLHKDRPGTKLGEGGGEPGKVLFARAAAIKAGDFNAFLATCSTTEAASANAAKAAGKDELASKFRFLGRITPPDVQVLGGTQVDDRAWLDFSNADRSVAGTMKLVRQEGRWLIDGGALRQ